MNKRNQNRRQFLKNAVKTTLGSAGAYTSLSSLSMMNAFAQPANDYRALVCIFLYGGNDSYNMFVPAAGEAYSQYATARTNMALSQSSILPVNLNNPDGNSYGFHPAMTEVQSLFNNDNLAVVANVGALVVPTDRDQYRNRRVPLPPRLFSHNDQQDFWHSLKTDIPQPRGWAGRMADAMMDANSNRDLAMNISLSGNNLMQVGIDTLPYTMSANGVIPFAGFNRSSNNAREQRRLAAFDRIMADNVNDNIFANEFSRIYRRAENLAVDVSTALGNVSDFSTTLPANNRLASTLATVARTIASRNELGMSRQIFFVGYGGWDTHANQLNRHNTLLGTLSTAMNYFYSLTEELNIENNVTTFTAADFGRTLTSNGDGTDHGWGSHQLVMGGAVRGGDLYGEIPELVIEGNQDSGRGRIIPTLSIDQYTATLASWYGLSASDVADIFPNLGNFNTTDLGFMA